MPTSFRRIVILSDGTWNTIDGETPSNIVKIAQCLAREDDAGIQQSVFYDSGIGTNGTLDRIWGGATGAGIDRNIVQLYTYLALNYSPGDEVYLFGFSRGAYTVRSLNGLIYECGLVRPEHIGKVEDAYELYRKNIGVDSTEATDFRREHGDRIPVKLIACFDTVGALGVPIQGPLSDISQARYAFHDTVLGDNVENGLHILSIDEERYAFEPTHMNANASIGPKQVKELYFWGTHGGVGGQPEPGKASLLCLVDEIRTRGMGLKFHMNRLPTGYDERQPAPPLPFSAGALRFLTGRFVRKIESVQQLHVAAVKRYKEVKEWRPDALIPLEEEILRAGQN